MAIWMIRDDNSSVFTRIVETPDYANLVSAREQALQASDLKVEWPLTCLELSISS